MHLVLYKYSGERNRVNKTSLLTQVLTTEGSFKGDVSLLSPTLLLSLPQEPRTLIDNLNNEIDEVITATEVLNFNYFYIKEFRRFYYVSSLVVSSNNLVTLTGEVDPLNSFQSEILANSAFVERNEFTYRDNEEDTLLPLSLTKVVDEYNVSTNSARVNTAFKASFAETDLNFVVCITSDGGAGSGSITPPDIALPTIEKERFTEKGGSYVMILDGNNVTILLQELLANYSAYSTFFKSLIALPFAVNDERIDPDLLMNITLWEAQSDGTFVEVTLTSKGYQGNSMSKYRVVADFQLPLPTGFLNYNPYSKYELYLPFYGWYELDFNSIAGDRIIVYYSIDYTDGSAQVYVYDDTDNMQLFSAPCNLAIPMAFSASNAQELGAQKNAAQLNLLLGLIGSGVGMIGSAVSGNVLGAVGSGLSAVGNVTGYINQTSLMFQKVTSTNNGSTGSLYQFLKVRLRRTSTRVLPSLNLTDFAHQYGRALNDVKTLSTLSGFTKCGSVHLEGCTATQTEKDSIVSSLLSGVIL